jgi:hypothetical protein
MAERAGTCRSCVINMYMTVEIVYEFAVTESTSVDWWLACSPPDSRFAGSIPTEVDGFLRVISKAVSPVS